MPVLPEMDDGWAQEKAMCSLLQQTRGIRREPLPILNQAFPPDRVNPHVAWPMNDFSEIIGCPLGKVSKEFSKNILEPISYQKKQAPL
jgi:hypothetical protein